MTMLENFMDVLGSLATGPISFLITLMIGFVLIFGLFLINACSMVILEIVKTIEHKRTGGRMQNELELNSFSSRF